MEKMVDFFFFFFFFFFEETVFHDGSRYVDDTWQSDDTRVDNDCI